MAAQIFHSQGNLLLSIHHQTWIELVNVYNPRLGQIDGHLREGRSFSSAVFRRRLF